MELEKLELDEFLTRNNISRDDWDAAEINFEELRKIGLHHKSREDQLNKEAEHIAARIQKVKQVHSVRWRVKDPEHLMEKIVRKKNQKEKKYSTIDENNYRSKVTDLIGVRVLHLFKNEWEDIHEKILELWRKVEKPVAYTRSGDESELAQSYTEKDCKVKIHKDAYRSIHYIISTEATKDKILCEIQVRTIFEEGWSEIDHKIRYPNFMNNHMVSYFLRIFNRLAGSADEMGSFISSLKNNIEIYENTITESNREKQSLKNEISELMSQIQTKNKSSEDKKESNNLIDQLQLNINKLLENHNFPTENNLSSTLEHWKKISESNDYLSLMFEKSAKDEENNKEKLPKKNIRRYAIKQLKTIKNPQKKDDE